MRSRRSLTALLAAMLLAVAAVTPAAAGREFGTIYIDDLAYRTFANPARVDAGTGTDPIVAFTNFDQGGVAKHAPGDGARGGRWAVWMATWTDPAAAHLLTDFDDVMDLVASGDLTIERVEGADFRCPILPPGRGA
ncbi:MAG TPA: hypothetical protein VLA76_05855 [Candidatus Angelobacter sp.]|nr:hypothetical protein [Candidatus Angelobacter sp.]